MYNNSNQQQQQQRQQQQQSSSSMNAAEERLRELQHEQALLQQQIALQRFAANYEIQLSWPAQIVSGNTATTTNNNNTSTTNSSIVRTSKDLIQHRLLEAGVLYEIPTTTSAVLETCNTFITDLDRTDCFDAIQITLGATKTTPEDEIKKQQKQKQEKDDINNNTTNEDETQQEQERTLQVMLHEKKWYKLKIGGGLKTDSNNDILMGVGSTFGSSNSDSFLPMAEAEVSIGLRNITGYLDKTEMQYTLDTKSIGTLSLIHSRPFYSILPKGILQDAILGMPTGSQYQLLTRAALDTVDHEYTRGYKEYQRLVSIIVSNIHNVNPQNALVTMYKKNNWYGHIEWNWLYRDIIPRRHTSIPYHYDASSYIVNCSGPSVKHSIHGIIQYHSPDLDHPILPTTGYQIHAHTELATPPGDVGYIKNHITASKHMSILSNALLAIHTNLSTGYIHPLSFGGLCNNNNNNYNILAQQQQQHNISDRFFVGGIGSFRGFVPAGIGPRSYVHNTTTAAPTTSSSRSTIQQSNVTTTRTGLGGNALGGDFFYTSTIMASSSIPNYTPFGGLGLQLFCFGSAGTCINIQSLLTSPLYTTTTTTNNNNNQINYNNLIWDIIKSSRVSAGIGIATAALGPRLEVTYAIPIRYGPRDGRRRFQFGMSFSI